MSGEIDAKQESNEVLDFTKIPVDELQFRGFPHYTVLHVYEVPDHIAVVYRNAAGYVNIGPYAEDGRRVDHNTKWDLVLRPKKKYRRKSFKQLVAECDSFEFAITKTAGEARPCALLRKGTGAGNGIWIISAEDNPAIVEEGEASPRWAYEEIEE